MKRFFTIRESLDLYSECVAFEKTGVTPEGSYLRQAAEKVFPHDVGKINIGHLTFTTKQVFFVLAESYWIMSDVGVFDEPV